MAKSKYNEEIVQELVGYVEEFGIERIAFERASISRDTYYKWKNKYSEFTDRIKAAKLKFRENNTNSELGLLALATMKDMMENGKKVTKTVEAHNKKVTKLDGAGNVISEEITEIPEHTIKAHFPVADSVLKNCAPPLNIEEAKKLLEAHGYIIFPPLTTTQHIKNLAPELSQELANRLSSVNEMKD